MNQYERESSRTTEYLKETGAVQKVIPQNSPDAILARKVTTELFSLEGFDVSRSNVEIISKNNKRLRVKDAVYDNDFVAEFDYDEEKDQVRNVKLKRGNFKTGLGSAVFSRQGIGKSLTREINRLSPEY